MAVRDSHKIVAVFLVFSAFSFSISLFFSHCFSLFPAVSSHLGTPKQPTKWGYRLLGCNSVLGGQQKILVPSNRALQKPDISCLFQGFFVAVDMSLWLAIGVRLIWFDILGPFVWSYWSCSFSWLGVGGTRSTLHPRQSPPTKIYFPPAEPEACQVHGIRLFEKLDDCQITHLIFVRLKHLLYDFF